jgi:molybdopterin-guanine dinucleotide biosynthesis protein A
MSIINNLYGIVICGGKSSRMGLDKSMIEYHEKPQRYYIYEMLSSICGSVFISCNEGQEKEMNGSIPYLTDLPFFENSGPVAGLLTAFAHYPDKDFLVTGCDYPFIKEADLIEFLSNIEDNKCAAAFFNPVENLYEPLLAYYSSECETSLWEMFHLKDYSLQQFLKRQNAGKYIPRDTSIICSINTPEELTAVRTFLKEKNKSENLV